MTTREEIRKYKHLKGFEERITPAMLLEFTSLRELAEKKAWRFASLLGKDGYVARFIKYGVEDGWCERVTALKEFHGRSISLEAQKCRYGDEIGVVKYRERCAQSGFTMEAYEARYGKTAAEALSRSKASTDEASFIRRYGAIEGKRRRAEYLEKWRKAQPSCDNGLSLKSFIDRHGEEQGYAKWDARRKKQSRRFSKEWYLEKYGETVGVVEWEKYREHMASISLKGAENNSSTYSKVSQRLFFDIAEKAQLSSETVFFAENNKEVKFKLEKYKQLGGGHYFAVDFLYGKSIIEFDGRYWHSREEVREKDKLKTMLLEEEGYRVLRIAENDYRENPLMVLNKCVAFINKEKKE